MFLFVFGLGFGVKVSAATYYVDSSVIDTNIASDIPDFTTYNHLTFTTTGGNDAVFATVADVNVFTNLQPGDIVLFRRGQTWRENLTIPASGNISNYIYFGAYGTGNNPILNGSTYKPNADFTLYKTIGSIFDVPTTNNLATGGNRNYRSVISAGADSTTVKIRLRASDSADWVIGGVSIGERLGSTNATVATPTRITWVAAGGGDGITITAGTYADSDIIAFPITAGSEYLVHVYMTQRNLKQSATGSIYYDFTGVDESLLQTPDIGQLSSLAGGQMVETIFGSNDVSVYSTEQIVDPMAVIEDNIFLAEKTALDRIVGAGQYFWNGSDTLYVTAMDGSAVPSNNKMYEVYKLQYNIFDNAKSYIDISNIDCKASFNNDSTMGGIYLRGDHNVVHDLSVYSGMRHLFSFYVGADNNLAYNLNIYDSYDTSNFVAYGSGTTDNVLRNSNIYQSANQPNLLNNALIRAHGNSTDNIVSNNNIYNEIARSNSGFQNIDIYDSGTSLSLLNNYITLGSSQNGILIGNSATTGAQIISGNVIYGPDEHSIFYIKDSPGSVIYNNTIIGNTSAIYPIVDLVNSESVVLKNNILYGGYAIRGDVNSETGFASNYNDFYDADIFKWTWGVTDYATLNDWQTNSNSDINSINTDSLFINSVSNFQLQASSPAIDSGTNVGLTTDYAGNNIYGIPDIGAYEYQPPYTVGTDNIPTTGSIRIYSDGKYRMKTASTTSTTIDFSVAPQGGNYYATTTQYMDLTIDTWQTTGDKNKQWTATSTTGTYLTHATSTIYTIGDLAPSTYYQFKIDNMATTTAITGNTCTDGVCLSDSSGNLTFIYSGGYSTHTFALEKDTSSPTSFTTTSSDTTVSGTAKPTLSWNASSDTLSGLAKYQLYWDNTLDTDNISTSTTSISPSTNMSCGSHTWYIKAIDNNGNITTSDTQTVTMTCDTGTIFQGSFMTDVHKTPITLTTQTNINTSTLTQTQITSILNLLTSFNADQLVIDKVRQALAGESIITEKTSCYQFKKDLKIGDTHIDVKELQKLLNSNPQTQIATSGAGSVGNETNYFGNLTKQAVIKFQNNHASEILTPVGLTKGTGYVGSSTRLKLNVVCE